MNVDNNRKNYMYIASRDMNREQFSELVFRAKGDDRSLTEFARLCHVSTSTLSRIINMQNLKASSVELLKAITENAAEDSGVSFDLLMSANGYARVEMIEAEEVACQTDQYLIEGSDVESFLNAVRGDMKSSRSDRGKVYRLQQKQFVARIEMYRASLQKYIHDQGHDIGVFQSKESTEEYKDSTVPFDFIIETDALSADQKKWVFCIRDIGLEDVNRVFYEVFYMLYLLQPKENQYKLTILMSQKRAFDKLCSMFQDVRIRDPFSVMLINEKTRRIVKEFIPNH